ncbi:2-oxoisovalerate dehydrogenase subunit beta 1, mitochondrial [Neochlamydia sp. AcF65]|uniref:alpha-ketoacid dehydrogenase subunit beta n=1 Tax=unclassified Neochlamydia TaxID=2643326 RepID=UPI00140E4C48|nr:MULTISPECIES: alpha-ketoacid dehydrogenase subunit beta [unclassified Neochlamydia]MBS4166894.1 2-oxoisovalerate dehydrogenase subunit beta 1, mitochondrial [Neochlamydia sp. AcF65]NGY94610.1 2-oxoisovalerate dehydrogenase subunit beta 1, mitochondrial [Neochlamydia sp. AcF84]
MAIMNIIQSLNHTLHQEFTRDARLLTFGEDVGAFGGVFRVTTGLQEKFGEERCFDTPLAEAGIVGFGIGIAQKGLKPICEIQFADYIYPAFDQIVNEMAKMRYRTGNQYSSAMVIRTPYGGGIHGGHYHSQSPEAFFLHIPGLVVAVISSPYDAKGLLASAIRSNDPVLLLEPKRIYRSLKQEVPEEEYLIPFGQAHVERAGRDITLIGWGAQHHQNKQAAEELAQQENIDVEVINLRTLNPLDIHTLVASVNKTGRCVVCHEAPLTQGFGAEISALIHEHCLLKLQAPVKRCCGLDTPFPHTLEKEYLPDTPRVKKAILETLNY